MGLDIGDKRIGLALSDPMGILASPLTIIARTDDGADIEAIIQIIRQHKVETIVVGLPYSLDGSLGKQAEKVQDFVEQLRRHIEIPMELRDERLSTAAAKRLIKAASTKKTKKPVPDDAIAAAIILQNYLDEGR
ncbi:MAG: Holliday junction resolvase RuvX [Chloroflexi bacterium]|nr:Holliday junction resolvase RuvX [Chloroflexota bacterium]